MSRIISTDDSVNACDCCGKTGLKFTFVVELECGEIVHYGSVCVTKHTGKTVAKAQKEIEAAKAEAKAKLQKEYDRTFAAIQYEAKKLQAHKAGLIGVPFRDFCAVEAEAARAEYKRIFG